MERDERGHWLPGRSANPGGRPGVPEVIKATLRELSPRAVERLGELLDSDDERIRLEAAKAILDRHLGRPAIQADLTVRGGASAEHLQALIEVARKRRAEPIVLDERRRPRHHAVPVRPEVAWPLARYTETNWQWSTTKPVRWVSRLRSEKVDRCLN